MDGSFGPGNIYGILLKSASVMAMDFRKSFGFLVMNEALEGQQIDFVMVIDIVKVRP